MGKKKSRASVLGDLVEFYHHILEEKPLLPFVVPLILFFWTIERWFFSLSNWVPLVLAVWATLQYGSYQRRILAEDLNREWKQIILRTTPITPLEHCEWLNKLFMEVWPSYFNPKFSIRFSNIVEKRLKNLKSRLIEKIELLEFSLGSYPPSLGLHGTRWSTSGDQKIMRLGFDWDTNDMSILLLAKLAKPLMGTARIVINSLHIKGDLLLMPVLYGKAILYSFVSAPEVRIGIAFGSGGSQSLPATELPGVSSWLVKILTDTLVRTMVEPRRRCFSLPAVDLRKKAVGCSIYVTVISGSKLSKSSLRVSPSRRQQQNNSTHDALEEQHLDERDLQTFVEVEAQELTRRTHVRSGSSPKWNSTFNVVLHEDTGVLRFHLFEATPNSVKYDYLTSCEIKVKYAADDSTTYWAIGPNSSAIAKHAPFCGKEVDMVVPFEGVSSGELSVRLVLREWQFSDGSHSSHTSQLSTRPSLYGSSNLGARTGRKISVSIVEGKDLMVKDKCSSYVKLQYGKTLQKTRTSQASTPTWNQKFEFEEIGDGEYLKIKCYAEETFGDENIGSARVNLEGLVEGSVRDVWIPLEKANSGELRLQIEAVRVDDSEGSKGSSKGSGNGLVELAIIEAKDLVAADIRGTSDPYVRVQYGNSKRRTKIMYKTLTPRWDQTFEFPDNGSPLLLHVKDHNALLPTSSIGDCVVEYQRLPPNQMFDKWIPLQGVKRGEIHIQVMRKIPEMQKRPSLDSEPSLSRAHETSSQMKKMMLKTQSMVVEGDLDGLATVLSEMESIGDMQEDYMMQLKTEQTLLLDKIKELGEEMFSSSPSQNGKSSEI